MPTYFSLAITLVQNIHLSRGLCAISIVCNNLCVLLSCFFTGMQRYCESKHWFEIRLIKTRELNLKKKRKKQLSIIKTSWNQRCTEIALNVSCTSQRAKSSFLDSRSTRTPDGSYCCIFTSFIVQYLKDLTCIVEQLLLCDAMLNQ